MNIQRDQGLDALKAMSIIFVLILHLRPIKFLAESNSDIVIIFFNDLVKTFNLQVARTAVPIFYIVSLYLFFQKNRNQDYFKKRLINLFKIFIFWSVIQIIFATVVNGKLPNFSWKIIIGVEPALPLVSETDSVLYFLFNLMILIVLAFLYQNLNSKIRKSISYIIVIFSLIFFELFSLLKLPSPYYFVGTFIIYIPIAFALVNYKAQIFKFKFYYLAAYSLFSIHDTILRYSSYGHTNYGYFYARIAVVSGALTLFCFIYPWKIKQNWYIQQLAKYSLGFFTLHKYWQYIVLSLTKNYTVNLNTVIPLDISSLFISFLVVFFTSITIALLNLTSLKRFVA